MHTDVLRCELPIQCNRMHMATITACETVKGAVEQGRSIVFVNKARGAAQIGMPQLT